MSEELRVKEKEKRLKRKNGVNSDFITPAASRRRENRDVSEF